MADYTFNENQEHFLEPKEFYMYDTVGTLLCGSCTFGVCLIAVIGLLHSSTRRRGESCKKCPDLFMATFFGFSGIALFLSGALPSIIVSAAESTDEANNTAPVAGAEALQRLILGFSGIATTSLLFVAMGLLLSTTDNVSVTTCTPSCTTWWAISLVAYTFTMFGVIFNNQTIIAIFQFLVLPFAALAYGTQETNAGTSKSNQKNVRIAKVVALLLIWLAPLLQLFVFTARPCPSNQDGEGSDGCIQDYSLTNRTPQGLIVYQVVSLFGFGVLACAELLLPSFPEKQTEGDTDDGDTVDMSITTTANVTDQEAAEAFTIIKDEV